MSHSNSSLNCFASCMAKYEHSYILKTPPCKPISPHLTFGVMAHEVLEKAGRQRDEIRDGVREKTEYMTVIPSEILYQDLKEAFKIPNWQEYFVPIIRKVAQYEKELLATFEDGDVINIEREVKMQVSVDRLKEFGYTNVTQPLVGVIDLLIWSRTKAIVIDYKFSTNKKTQDDFDMNSQLPVYMFLVNENRGIPINDIEVGYIDIPKQVFDKPSLLKNGLLSRSSSQNVDADVYKACVTAIHGDDEYYNCDPGGYYFDCYCSLKNNKPAYLSYQYLDRDAYEGILNDILDAANMVDFMTQNKMKFIKKYDVYSCKGCEYLKACKKWLEVNW